MAEVWQEYARIAVLLPIFTEFYFFPKFRKKNTRFKKTKAPPKLPHQWRARQAPALRFLDRCTWPSEKHLIYLPGILLFVSPCAKNLFPIRSSPFARSNNSSGSIWCLLTTLLISSRSFSVISVFRGFKKLPIRLCKSCETSGNPRLTKNGNPPRSVKSQTIDMSATREKTFWSWKLEWFRFCLGCFLWWFGYKHIQYYTYSFLQYMQCVSVCVGHFYHDTSKDIDTIMAHLFRLVPSRTCTHQYSK